MYCPYLYIVRASFVVLSGTASLWILSISVSTSNVSHLEDSACLCLDMLNM
jgi:hypothetical protein